MPPRRQCNRQALHPFKPQAANVNPFLLGVKGGYSLSEEREYPPLPLPSAGGIFFLAKRQELLYAYMHNVKPYG